MDLINIELQDLRPNLLLNNQRSKTLSCSRMLQQKKQDYRVHELSFFYRGPLNIEEGRNASN